MPRGGARHGAGRPRKPNKPRADGYVPATVGPKGRGTKTLEHRVKAGIVGKGPDVVADHKSGVRSDNSRSNLSVTSRGENTARSNRKRGKK